MPPALLVSLPDATRSKYGRRGIVWRTSAGSWLCCKSNAKKEGRVCFFSVRVSALFDFFGGKPCNVSQASCSVQRGSPRNCGKWMPTPNYTHISSTPTEQATNYTASHFHGSWTRNVSPNSSTSLGVASLAMAFLAKRALANRIPLVSSCGELAWRSPWSTMIHHYERFKACVVIFIHQQICIFIDICIFYYVDMSFFWGSQFHIPSDKLDSSLSEHFPPH